MLRGAFYASQRTANSKGIIYLISVSGDDLILLPATKQLGKCPQFNGKLNKLKLMGPSIGKF